MRLRHWELRECMLRVERGCGGYQAMGLGQPFLAHMWGASGAPGIK